MGALNRDVGAGSACRGSARRDPGRAVPGLPGGDRVPVTGGSAAEVAAGRIDCNRGARAGLSGPIRGRDGNVSAILSSVLMVNVPFDNTCMLSPF